MGGPLGDSFLVCVVFAFVCKRVLIKYCLKEVHIFCYNILCNVLVSLEGLGNMYYFLDGCVYIEVFYIEGKTFMLVIEFVS